MIKKVLLILFLTNVIIAQTGFHCPEKDIEETRCKGPKDCFYPHPDRCDQFIYCEVNADGVTGRPIVKDCPDSLKWDDHNKECGWPEDSTCGKGPTV